MKTGLVGPSYTERSLPFDAQRSINLYPVSDPQGKEVSALYATPGLQLFTTCGVGPIRGEFISSNGRAFAVSNSNVYEIFSNGTNAVIGTLLTPSSIVSMDENPNQLGICDGTYFYIFTYATNVFAQVTDPDLPNPAATVTFIDGYFVINKGGTGQFYISAINDGFLWDPLKFATAESSPDALLRVYNAVGQLWLLGVKTTEIYTDTGAAAFPFERISGAKMGVGILAPYTALEVDNSLFWVGADAIGQGIVYRARGFSPQRISTNPIELILQSAPTPSTLRAYTYQQDGHTFYVIAGGGLATTLVYDVSTQLWHERCYLNALGNLDAHLGICGIFAFNKQLVGSRLDGSIYTMSPAFLSDNGQEIVGKRIFTHIGDENKRIRYSSLKIYMENGVGTQTGQGQNPEISLRLSKDGARTWSTIYTKPIGAAGKYRTEVNFRRLGVSEVITFEVTISDPVKRALIGAYLS